MITVPWPSDLQVQLAIVNDFPVTLLVEANTALERSGRGPVKLVESAIGSNLQADFIRGAECRRLLAEEP